MSDIVAEATTLRLSFKNIFKIDNLQGFEKLTMLCLDNNIIEEIVNLEHLVNLQWLDLSFNNITEIQGMDSLVNLQDLSLYNNSIEKIQGLDNCTKLNCLSIGNNDIRVLDNLMYLRIFKNLRLLNLEGNPVCSDAEYRMYMLAHLKNLKYLDYALVHEADVVAAKEQYQDELLEIEEKESIEEAAQDREATRKKQSDLLKAANLDVVETLFDDMFKEDTEMTKLKLFPGLTELLENYRDNFNSVSETFKTAGLENLDERQKEYKLYLNALNKMRKESEAEAVKIIEKYNKYKKKCFRELKSKEHVEAADLDSLKEATNGLGDTLTDLEIQQVEKFEDLINELENAFNEMRTKCLDAHQTYFRGVEELEDAYFEALNQLTTDLLDKSQNDLLGDEISDDVKNILMDRDLCLNAVAGSHDIHVGKLLGKEDEMRLKEIQIFNELLEKQKEEEYERNRKRGMEIHQLLERNLQEMDDLLEQENMDDEDQDV